jgi:DNA-binding MarR family transcriptional regulator
MNRQLLADSGMSLPDYDVLTALSVADECRMQITVLAAQIGWERSRVSHHVRRMSARGLVTCGPSAADRRVTEVTLTGRGRRALEEAAPGHVDLVRRLFFEGLPDGLVGPLSEALESVYANIIKHGSLPPPVDWHPAGDLPDQASRPAAGAALTAQLRDISHESERHSEIGCVRPRPWPRPSQE